MHSTSSHLVQENDILNDPEKRLLTGTEDGVDDDSALHKAVPLPNHQIWAINTLCIALICLSLASLMLSIINGKPHKIFLQDLPTPDIEIGLRSK